MSTLYEADFYTWTRQQAEGLRTVAELRLNTLPDLDWQHLSEEIESLGASLERELYSRYKIILTHLLKWRFQPERRSSNWQGTIDEQRDQIAVLIADNPGLRPKRSARFERAYAKARRAAVIETEMPDAAFPVVCPFTLEQAEDEDFWPDPQATAD